jgi:uncharacterized protein YggE
MKWLAIVIGILLISCIAAAGEIPSITVVGEGTVTVPADVVYIAVGVANTNDNATLAEQVNAAQLNATLEALIAAGIDREDILPGYARSTQSTQIYTRVGNNTTCEVESYNVANLSTTQVTIQLDSTDEDFVDKILETAESSGASAGVSGYGLSDTSSAMAEARKKAVEDARENAEELAYLYGATLGGVLSIYELSYPQISSSLEIANLDPETMWDMFEESESQILSFFGMISGNPEMLDVTSSVRVTYEIIF